MSYLSAYLDHTKWTTYIDKGLAHEFRIADYELGFTIITLGDSLNTVESGKEDHLSITICRNSLDMFPQLLQDLFSVLLISLSLV